MVGQMAYMLINSGITLSLSYLASVTGYLVKYFKTNLHEAVLLGTQNLRLSKPRQATNLLCC